MPILKAQKLEPFSWFGIIMCLYILFVVIFPHFEQWFFSGLWKCWNFVFRSLILSMSSRLLCVLSNVTRCVLVAEKEYIGWFQNVCVSWFLWMTLTERKRGVEMLCNHLDDDGIVVWWVCLNYNKNRTTKIKIVTLVHSSEERRNGVCKM